MTSAPSHVAGTQSKVTNPSLVSGVRSTCTDGAVEIDGGEHEDDDDDKNEGGRAAVTTNHDRGPAPADDSNFVNHVADSLRCAACREILKIPILQASCGDRWHESCFKSLK
jgi:hypothetical protein